MGFCPGCGKRTVKDFCKDCRPRTVLEAKPIVVKICPTCKKMLHKNTWSICKNPEEAISRIAKTCIKGYNGFNIIPSEDKKGGFDVEVEKDGDLFLLPAEIRKEQCPACSKRSGSYFEGVLQLRNIDNETISFIDKFLMEERVFVSGRTETKQGFDLQISDQHKLQNLGQQLARRFGGTVKISERQFSQDRQTSKQTYRVNVLYDGPRFKIGDVMRYERGIFLVTQVRKEISAINLKTGKKETLPVIPDMELVPLVKTTVTKVYPALEVMDPDTYQSIPAYSSARPALGEKVKAARSDGVFYII
ncbi:MAG: hypothetical protein HGA85_09315 [Nanoarchaeota archaeon]|nr:hypothetical protein [Nanoarchaeota archaeon]